MLECHYHSIDSPIFSAAHLIFKNAGDDQYSVTPLFIYLLKLEKSRSVNKIVDVLLKEKNVISLIIATLLTLPPDQQWIRNPGEKKITILEMRQKLILVEAQLYLLQKEGNFIDDVNVLINKLLYYHEVQMVIQVYELFNLHNRILYSYLGKEWHHQMKAKGVKSSLYNCCSNLFRKDCTGVHMATFMDCILEEDPCAMIPPLVLEILEEHARDGYSSYSSLFDVLAKYKVWDEACNLVQVAF